LPPKPTRITRTHLHLSRVQQRLQRSNAAKLGVALVVWVYKVLDLSLRHWVMGV
jgi:hypothetical protein